MGRGALEGALCGGAGALMDVALIETILWDGACCPRLAGHEARLARSAAQLGFPYVPGALQSALPRPEGPARLRATLGADGALAVTAAPLPPAAAQWRLGLADQRLWSGDPWLRVKSTRRALYDAARAALPDGVDELIFLNERGEVCEGTITNIFFDRGQGLRTPPLACGVLPGVLRAELACPEEMLWPQDLPRVQLWVGNALRGLIPAVWVG